MKSRSTALNMSAARYVIGAKCRVFIGECVTDVHITAKMFDAKANIWTYIINGKSCCGNINRKVTEEELEKLIKEADFGGN